MIKQLKSHPIVSSTLARYLHAWTQGRKSDYAGKLNQHNEVHKIIYLAVQEQDTIGWEHAVRERFSKNEQRQWRWRTHNRVYSILGQNG